MKKYNYILLAAAGLAMASCSQEEVTMPTQNGDGNFHVTISRAETLKSRADIDQFGEGFVADQLNIAVYDSVSNTLVQTSLAEFPADALSTQVDFNLVRGKSYKIAFFAQSKASMNSANTGATSNAVYTFNAEAGTVDVNYANMTSANNLADAYDCFYNVLNTGVIGTSEVNTSVVLNRPVAQVNWGTNDLTYVDGEGLSQDKVAANDNIYGSKGQYIQTTLTVTKPYNRLNLLTGGISQSYASGDAGVTEIKGMAAPYQFTFPLEDTPNSSVYTYVAMTYMLAPKSTTVIYNLVLDIDNNLNPAVTTTSDLATNTIVPVDGVPVQANYQTNIYGSLLTEDVEVTVNKNNVWTEPAYEKPLKWDGSTYVYPTLPEDTTQPVVISDAPTLAGFAAMVAGTNQQEANDMQGYTFELGADIDMGGNDFPAIGSVTSTTNPSNATNVLSSVEGNAFAGTFDGKGHTISNVTVSASSQDATTPEIVGIFPNLTGTVKDVTFTGLQLKGQTTTNNDLLNATGVVGVVNGGTVEGVTVTSGTVEGGNNTGAIAGAVLDGTVEDCSNGAAVSGQNKVGGVIGSAYGVTSGSNITVSGCTNTGNVTGAWTTGGVIGLSNANVSDCDNSGTVTATNNSVGGVISEQRTGGSVSSCNNSGTVTSSSASYGVGGVVGWIRYIPQGEDTASLISVTGCSNSANITGGYGVSGIVGIWYAAGTCTDNTNTAQSLVAGGNFVGGIVGQSNQSTKASAPNQSAELTITGCSSTTTWDNLSCPTGKKGLIVYIDGGEVTMSDNTPDYNTPDESTADQD